MEMSGVTRFESVSGRNLPTWSYFPEDVDTADLGSETWWAQRVTDLATAMNRLRPAAVCSPALAPRAYGAAYYSLTVGVANRLREALEGTGIEVVPTVVATMRDLASPQRVMEMASIATQTEAQRVRDLQRNVLLNRKDICSAAVEALAP